MPMWTVLITGPTNSIHKADGWTNYSTFSLWDTYRCLSSALYLYTRACERHEIFAFYDNNGRPVPGSDGSESQMTRRVSLRTGHCGCLSERQRGFSTLRRLWRLAWPQPVRDDYRDIGLCKLHLELPHNVTDSYNAETGRSPKPWSMLTMITAQPCLAEKLGERQVADECTKRSQNYKNVYNPEKVECSRVMGREPCRPVLAGCPYTTYLRKQRLAVFLVGAAGY